MTATDDRPAVEPPKLDQHDAAFVVAVLKVVSEDSKKLYDESRGIAGEQYFTNGDRITARHNGVKLGSVFMTDPDPKAEIVDREQLVEWMRTHRPDEVREVATLDTSRIEEILDVLAEHAPHLVENAWELTEQGEAAVKKLAVDPNADPMPGVEVRWPRGTVSTRLTAEGKDHIRGLIAAGDIDALRALPAKEA